MKINLSSLRIPQSFADNRGAKKVLTSVPLCKGQRQTFFMVNPDDNQSPDLFLLEQKEGGSDSYLVSESMVPELGKDVVPKRLYSCVDQFGNPFFWPVKIALGDERLDSWNESAHRAAATGREKWIRITPNQQAKGYDTFIALGTIADPKWPEKSLEELLHLAFADRYIESADHPMVKRLKGFT